MPGSITEPSHLRFGVYELDLTTGELRKSGVLIHLPPQPFKILALLAGRSGQLVTREEIQEQVWGSETFVDFDHGLNFAIKKIREALGDNAETPRYIETLPRRGYRFIAPVETARRAVSDEETLHRSVSTAHGGASAVAPVPPPADAVAASDREADVGAGLALPSGAQQAAPLPRRWIVIAAGAAILVVVALILALNVGGLRERFTAAVGAGSALPYPKIESIAVLPLENLSGDKEQEYFADGMTDELIAELGQISSLRVISRTSMMRYKGARKPLPEIARELNVEAVVEGSVLRAENWVRITVNLIDAKTDRHLWAHSYEAELRDVLTLQSELAHAIVQQVQAELTPQEQTRLAGARPVNPEAYEAYLKGRFLCYQTAFYRSGQVQFRQNLANALDYFQLALKKDPNYAPGYVGMSLVWLNRGNSDYISPREALPEAKGAALNALELDDELAEAHWALANIQFYFEWDWAAAEKEYQRAIELDPNSAAARANYMDLLHVMGRPREAKAEIERALQLDPLNPQARLWHGIHLQFSRDYDAGIAEAREWLKMDPESGNAHIELGVCFRQKGMFEDALAEEKKLHASDPEYVEALDRGNARGGFREAYREASKLLEVRYRQNPAGECEPMLHVFAGQYDQAIKCLERRYEYRSPEMVHLGVYPEYDPLRSDPRFQALLRRMNFPP